MEAIGSNLEDYIKATVTQNSNNQKDDEKIRQDLLKKIKIKKESDAKALKTVEFLIDGKFPQTVFLQCLKYLNKSYYQDLVNERSINKCCGYCLCGNKLQDFGNRQFYIDGKYNKIYDITERKNYCSNFCYKASCHIEEQLDDCPLWLKDSKEIQNYILLESLRGTPGKEIKLNSDISIERTSFTSVYSFAEASLKELDEGSKIGHGNKNSKYPAIDNSKYSKTDFTELCNKIESIDLERPLSINSNTDIKDEIEKPAQKNSKGLNNIKPKSNTKTTPKILKKYIQEWITLDTYIFLYGEAHIKKFVTSDQLEKYFKNVQSIESPAVENKYLKICQKLASIGCVEEKFERKIIGSKLKSIPDYKTLKEESKTLKVKVRSFYDGVTYTVDDQQQEATKQNSQISEEENFIAPPVINSQTAIRHNTFMNGLSKAVEILTPNLDIPSHYVLQELQLLVKTFNLQPYSIVFHPTLWNVLALFLIKMLTIRNSVIKSKFETAQSEAFIKQVMVHFPTATTLFIEFFENIQDIDLFLKTHFANIDV